MTSATENLTSLEVAILQEVNVRAAGDFCYLPILVEDYGMAVKAAVMSLYRKGLVELVGQGGVMSWDARELGLTVEQYEAGCIPGVIESALFCGVELKREQSFDF